MSLAETVAEISQVLDSPPSPGEAKEVLERLAAQLWREAFSIVDLGDYANLDDAAAERQWARISSEAHKFDNADQILEIAEWPASGGDLSRHGAGGPRRQC